LSSVNDQYNEERDGGIGIINSPTARESRHHSSRVTRRRMRANIIRTCQQAIIFSMSLKSIWKREKEGESEDPSLVLYI
jgi:hypothetical protein